MDAAIVHAIQMAGEALIALTAALVLIAAVDVPFQLWQYHKDMRMTRDEMAEPVDQQLVNLAQKIDGRIVTNDYNLNKVAKIRGVGVLNINDLAKALKPQFLPGEGMAVKIIKPGEEQGQGIGYLEDGTMVVVENGKAQLGQTATVVVTQVIQTERGKMIFAEIGPESLDAPARKRGR